MPTRPVLRALSLLSACAVLLLGAPIAATAATPPAAANAEVLAVISNSVADTQPVFDKILDSCERLFSANGMGIYLIDESGRLNYGGFRGTGEVRSGLAVSSSWRGQRIA